MKSPGDDWPEFLKRLKCLMRDSLRLDQIRTEKQPETFVARRARLEVRLSKLIDAPLRDCECRRLVKRLRRHASELFTILGFDGVTADKNHPDRQLRSAVLIRQNSYDNSSDAGA